MIRKKKVTKKKVVKKKTTVKKGAGGRPSKLTLQDKDYMKFLVEGGFTDKVIAKKLKVCEKTFHNWKLQNKEFLQSLRDWKIKADEEVERSLRERALGYTCEETKVFCTKDGNIKTHTVDRHFPPDATSMIFWLKNRRPDIWRDKQEIDLGNREGETFNFAFDLTKKPSHREVEDNE